MDVCAAPGSKTEQLLRLLHAKSTQLQQIPINSINSSKTKTPINSSYCPPTGMIVANDADLRRIRTLRDRLPQGLCANLLITNARAEDLHARVRSTMQKEAISRAGSGKFIIYSGLGLWPFLYTVVVLFHMEWCIRWLWCFFIITCNTTNIAYNQSLC